MAMPFTTVTVPPSYAPYQDAHYVNVSGALPYHQNVMYNSAGPEFINSHRATSPNLSRHVASRSQTSNDLDAAVVSPNRTVFLTKLPYSAIGPAIRRLLESYGRVERCDVPLDKTSPNKIQGTAIAKFKDTNDAARAIRNLNGYKWKGVTISARWDRDSASSNGPYPTSRRPVQVKHSSSETGSVADARSHDTGPQAQRKRHGEGPLIVNGSRGDIASCGSKRGSKEDDSDSSDGDGDDDEHSSSDGKLSLQPYMRLAKLFKKPPDLLLVAQATDAVELLGRWRRNSLT
jgi:RNA recognition motif-containing protein